MPAAKIVYSRPVLKIPTGKKILGRPTSKPRPVEGKLYPIGLPKSAS